MQYGGGRGGITSGASTALSSFSSESSTGGGVLGNIGEDRLCNDQDNNKNYVYYDFGALAVLYAIKKASENTGGAVSEPVALTNFFTSSIDVSGTTGAGFWLDIEPYTEMDYETDYPSDVPEGAGWRKALSEFTGYPNTQAFYTDFQAWASAATAVDMSEVITFDPADLQPFQPPSLSSGFPFQPKLPKDTNGDTCQADSGGGNDDDGGGSPPPDCILDCDGVSADNFWDSTNFEACLSDCPVELRDQACKEDAPQGSLFYNTYCTGGTSDTDGGSVASAESSPMTAVAFTAFFALEVLAVKWVFETYQKPDKKQE
mmetsp:Transcript_29438/g.65937  ORF Transcript_29438/g.65937 Transcript_29438/m.65937 type:complete len:316 (+) Transcript_29438:397-1344(+)